MAGSTTLEILVKLYGGLMSAPGISGELMRFAQNFQKLLIQANERQQSIYIQIQEWEQRILELKTEVESKPDNLSPNFAKDVEEALRSANHLKELQTTLSELTDKISSQALQAFLGYQNLVAAKTVAQAMNTDFSSADDLTSTLDGITFTTGGKVYTLNASSTKMQNAAAVYVEQAKISRKSRTHDSSKNTSIHGSAERAKFVETNRAAKQQLNSLIHMFSVLSTALDADGLSISVRNAAKFANQASKQTADIAAEAASISPPAPRMATGLSIDELQNPEPAAEDGFAYTTRMKAR